MVKLNYVLIKANHILEILYSLSHHRNTEIIALCPGQKNKQFCSFLNTNANYKNIIPVIAQQYKANLQKQNLTTVILCPPATFQELNQILKKGTQLNHHIVLCLLQQNKKYLNIISKKIQNLQISEMVYSPNKFIGINDKIREFVDKSYDMNRAGFYAYGQFINTVRSNLLKKIFRTQLLNLDELARSYGFTSAQRVKQGTFLKSSVLKSKKAEKRAQKRRRSKQNQQKPLQQQIENNQVIQNNEINNEKQQKKSLKNKKIKKLASSKVKKVKKVNNNT